MTLTVASSYNHVHDTLESVWTITHNLNILAPIVDCYLLIDGVYTKALPADVKVNSAVEIEIHWSEARTGKVRII